MGNQSYCDPAIASSTYLSSSPRRGTSLFVSSKAIRDARPGLARLFDTLPKPATNECDYKKSGKGLVKSGRSCVRSLVICRFMFEIAPGSPGPVKTVAGRYSALFRLQSG